MISNIFSGTQQAVQTGMLRIAVAVFMSHIVAAVDTKRHIIVYGEQEFGIGKFLFQVKTIQ